ncbi:rhodanese-like domain protein [Streptococcus oralis]|uniref:Putative adenylyltransferase/sulfurtransferase MoeZ n=1 Tax=Streptococcus oralis subsp. oralis TaxID=1891914 RepID=A0A0F2D9H5_STROR|nr:rhodanese-like domain-containing protein [Streptococcus oralis]KEQ45522.1 rhodanese-like domain protein [Streptococcus oralis]KJQ66894.1 putative adenylyltransferase/sulfurtransferase MoeZ [Streptococcus oralis subsp. oralis]KJQ70272.1 putative adenylyltransferase/sulfurtransferase MoeZ [Streptococcus oralis subsp. oralis]MBZ2077628.1 rhodanese-like domain-containing protein [Streptococcus oralis]QQK99755.1 rhodanese-like domain-containing protein [Streptococcus oralis]
MKEITFNDFYQLYQNGQLSLVDVREVEEFEALHLEGAHNLPLSQLTDTYDQLDKGLLHYVICKSGMRSARACQFLAEQGYEVINVQGGMTAFENL